MTWHSLMNHTQCVHVCERCLRVCATLKRAEITFKLKISNQNAAFNWVNTHQMCFVAKRTLCTYSRLYADVYNPWKRPSYFNLLPINNNCPKQQRVKNWNATLQSQVYKRLDTKAKQVSEKNNKIQKTLRKVVPRGPVLKSARELGWARQGLG